MSYYIRILSATTEAATPADLRAACERAGHPPVGLHGADANDPNWRGLDLEYGEGRCPLRLERALASTPGGFPEVARFISQIGAQIDAQNSKPSRSKAKKQLLAGLESTQKFLESTQQILRFQIPDHVIEDDEWGMVHALLYYLQPQLDGLIQADGEGIYDADGKLLVAMEFEGAPA